MPKKSIYSPPPNLAMEQTYRDNLLERTGKTAEQWVAVVKRDGPPDEKARRQWLKDAHAFTTNYAWWVAGLASGTGEQQYDPEAYVQNMFTGKEGLRPIFDAALGLAQALGKDFEICPCQTIVPMYRKHVFAQLKPSAKTRLDFGFALGETPFTERLLDTGGRAKKDCITHRVGLSSVADLDAEVAGWLKLAYDLDGVDKKRAKKS